jgi:hypothetical protein
MLLLRIIMLFGTLVIVKIAIVQILTMTPLSKKGNLLVRTEGQIQSRRQNS